MVLPPDVPAAALAAFRAELPGILAEARQAGHDVDRDPYLQLDPENLLRRYLIALDNNVAEAARRPTGWPADGQAERRRLRATIDWRREWNVLEYHQRGMAKQLFAEETNPGSEMYFASSCHVDKLGRPYVVGRGQYLNRGNIHPWRHLRAAVFVMERASVEVLRRGCGYASYILDIKEVPAHGTVSGTGGGDHPKDEGENPYWARGAGREAPEALVKRLGDLRGGMAVLRAAIIIGSNFYPELMARIVVLNSNWLFASAARIFKLWMHPRSRDKFHFLKGVDDLLEWYDASQLPVEWGGTGWRLDGDQFMAAAVRAYDGDPALPPAAGDLPAYAGWDAEDRLRARADAMARGYAAAELDEGERRAQAPARAQVAEPNDEGARGAGGCLACLSFCTPRPNKMRHGPPSRAPRPPLAAKPLVRGGAERARGAKALENQLRTVSRRSSSVVGTVLFRIAALAVLLVLLRVVPLSRLAPQSILGPASG